MIFKPHLQAEERKRSANELVKVLLASRKPGVLPEHLRELLGILLWKITQAESSTHKTRFQSQGALLDRSKGNLRHDHVYPSAKMIDALLAEPDKAIEILAVAVGCTVTRAEHDHLHTFDGYGWERYWKAGIIVMDTSKNPAEPVPHKG